MTDILLWTIGEIGGKWFAVAVVTVILVAGGIGVVIGMIRSRWEIKSLKSQIFANVAKMLEHTQEANRRYTDGMVRCGRLALELTKLLNQHAARQDIDSGREDFAACLLNETIPAFLDSIGWRRLDLEANNANPDSYDDLLQDSVDELRRFRKWLAVINHPTLLEYLKKGPQLVQLRTLRPFLIQVERFPPHIRNERMRTARAAVDDLMAPFPAMQVPPGT